MLKINEKTLDGLVRVAIISARRIRSRKVVDLSSMEHQIHQQLIWLGIVAEDTNDGRVGEILIPDVD